LFGFYVFWGGGLQCGLITFIVASLVIDGKLTLGAMLAIQYIIGQLNSPVEQFIGFTQQAQDAKISLERLNDIHALEDEEPLHRQFNHYLPTQQSIHVKNLSFTYPGAGNEPVLRNINVEIPEGKVTAIVGMSGGQKQRIAIARAVYKNPKFLFFDEATNSLDASNEKVILENLQSFFEGKTVVVVAHRLSTVKNADRILMMDNGEIVEEGTHAELIALKGKYYELVKNQLELGN